jgi:hypothetical protein
MEEFIPPSRRRCLRKHAWQGGVMGTVMREVARG